MAVLLLATGCEASVDVTSEEIITRSNDDLEVRPESDFVEQEQSEEEPTGVEEGVELADCIVEVIGSNTFASVPVSNATSQTVSVYTRVSVVDSNGNELATERPAVTDLRSGYSSQQWTQVWSPTGDAVEGAVGCTVLEARSEPPSDLVRSAGQDLPDGAFTCSVAGLDVVGDVLLELDIDNPFGEPRNMQALLAVLDADGVRVGTALPTVRDIEPGESLAVPFSTWVPGFVEASSCEVIWSIS